MSTVRICQAERGPQAHTPHLLMEGRICLAERGPQAHAPHLLMEGSSVPADWPTFLTVSSCCSQTELSTSLPTTLFHCKFALKKNKQDLYCGGEVWGLDRFFK